VSPPEFFVDRSLGKTTAAKLAQLGWTVHLVNDAFPNDAQNTPDEEWIAYGLGHGWAMLSKDQRIRYRADELVALAPGGVLFCLSNRNLTIDTQVHWFERSRRSIESAVSRGPGFYVVYATRIARTWPRRDSS
jgi:PIN domain-containing protein